MSNSPEPRLNDFLDDQMDSAQRKDFVDRLGKDVRLREEYEQQCAIDVALRRLYSEDRLEELVEGVEKAVAENPHAPASWRKTLRGWHGLSAAALVAISMAGLWYSWSSTRPAPIVDVYQPQPWRSFATVYYDTIRDGFKPTWICRNERQFERVFSRRFRQPLLLAALPSGMTAGGISYSNTMSGATINVLGKVEGTPVMIFVDKRTVDHGPPAPVPSDLQLFRREIDELVLYELTPLERPHILPYFYNPNPQKN